MNALGELGQHYRAPRQVASAWRAAGGQVVGCLGSDVPPELIVAAGMLPVRIGGDPRGDTVLADRYTGRSLDPVTRSQLNHLLDGTYAFLDYLVIGHDHDGLARLFYTLRELQRVEPVAGLPEFHFFDLLHLPYRTSAVYNRARARELRRVLEGWSGRSISDDDLRTAIAACNANRRLLQHVAALRTASPPRLTGVEVLQVIGAGMALPASEHRRLLEALLEDADRLPEHRGVRVFLTGSGHDTPEFYTLLEARGAVVVGEDHDWGDRAFADLVSEEDSIDPLDALVQRAHLGAPGSAKRGLVERATYTSERAAVARADVAICFIREGDDGPGWDVPQQRARLAQVGIPLCVLPPQPYRLTGSPDLISRVDELLGAVAPVPSTARV